MLLTLGVISIVLTLWIAKRMRILDSETAPFVRAVLSPSLMVSPTLTRIPTPQKTDLGRVMFANSITLTPGTVSVDVQDDHILVHALLSEMANPDDFSDMSERSAWAIGKDVDAPRHSKKTGETS